MEGNINVICASCMKLLKVKVNFPDSKKGFENKIHVCQYCNTELLITDPHVYDENGKIIS